MDAAGTASAVVVSLSRGASYALHLGAVSPAACHRPDFHLPDYAIGAVFPDATAFLKAIRGGARQ